jgi:MinD-like ATPase involved in chromosome partitioning or flagellar assembly
MSVIAFASVKGSPGVTTTTTALGAVWPEPALVVECDPSGGDLAVRLRGHGGVPFNPDRGLLAFTVSGETDATGPALLAPYIQTADGGLDVLVGLPSPIHAARLRDRAPDLALALRAAGRPVLVDCGRLAPEPTLAPILAATDLLVLMTRCAVDAAWHLRNATRWLAPDLAVPRRVVAVIGTPADARDVAEALTAADTPLPVIGTLPYDAAAARALGGAWDRDLDRTALVRAARALAMDLVQHVADAASALQEPR